MLKTLSLFSGDRVRDTDSGRALPRSSGFPQWIHQAHRGPCGVQEGLVFVVSGGLPDFFLLSVVMTMILAITVIHNIEHFPGAGLCCITYGFSNSSSHCHLSSRLSDNFPNGLPAFTPADLLSILCTLSREILLKRVRWCLSSQAFNVFLPYSA